MIPRPPSSSLFPYTTLFRSHSRRVSDEITMAVPVMLADRVLAAVVIRFAEQAVPLKLAVERFVPKLDRKSTRLNSSHSQISYAAFSLKKKNSRDFRNPASPE